MKTQFEKLREKINEAQNEIKKEKGELSYVFNKALESVIYTMEEIEIEEDEFKIGEYYFFYDDFKEEKFGFIYGKLVDMKTVADFVCPYGVELPYGTRIFWYSAISKELPLHLLNPLND
jgi:hypothetical protein